MSKHTGAQALLEQLRSEERSTWGIDPDGTAYLDAAERIERVRTAYRLQLERESPAASGKARLHVSVSAASER